MKITVVAHPGQYRLLARISGDDRIATYRARREDGQSVLVHQLTPGQDHSEVLRMAMAYMLRNPADKGGRILDLFDSNGTTHLVTTNETACLAFREWLQWEATQVSREARPSDTQQPRAVQRPAPPPPPLPPAPAQPAAITKNMNAPLGEAPRTVAMQPPGEFTRIIQNPARVEPPKPPVSARQPMISSPALPVIRTNKPPSGGISLESGFRLVPFLVSFLVVLALFLIAVVVIRQLR
jgi:hypothetical protein